jgi:hypothetical protein
MSLAKLSFPDFESALRRNPPAPRADLLRTRRTPWRAGHVRIELVSWGLALAGWWWRG